MPQSSGKQVLTVQEIQTAIVRALNNKKNHRFNSQGSLHTALARETGGIIKPKLLSQAISNMQRRGVLKVTIWAIRLTRKDD